MIGRKEDNSELKWDEMSSTRIRIVHLPQGPLVQWVPNDTITASDIGGFFTFHKDYYATYLGSDCYLLSSVVLTNLSNWFCQ